MEEAAPAPPPKRSALGLAFLAILAVGGSAVGVIFYQLGQNKEKAALDTSGFDIAQALEGPKASGTAAPSGPGTGMQTIATGMQGINFSTPGKAVQDVKAKLEVGFREHVRRSEKAVNELALQYLAKNPAARQFAKDWLSKEDLYYLSAHYTHYHDPVFFLRELAKAPSFGPIVKQYATSAVAQSFLKDILKVVPQNSLSAGMDYVQKEGAVKPVVESAMQALGLPPGMFGGSAAAAASPPKLDAQSVLSGVMGANPEMSKAMSNPEIQKAMNDPAAQKALQQQQGLPTK